MNSNENCHGMNSGEMKIDSSCETGCAGETRERIYGCLVRDDAQSKFIRGALSGFPLTLILPLLR